MLKHKVLILLLSFLGILQHSPIFAGAGEGYEPLILDSYHAYLSPRDHQHSSGAKLTEAIAILQQDRANVHRFGYRDALDEGDNFFITPEKRQQMYQMALDGPVDANTRQRIVNENVLVQVQILHPRADGTLVYKPIMRVKILDNYLAP